MSEPLNPEQLAAIEARANAATPGPWQEHSDYGKDFYAYLGGSYLRGVGTLTFGDGEEAEADRAFVLNARTDIPALLAEIERLRARVAELETAAAEGRAALGALCYDLEDPGTAALGALHLLTRATVWAETGPDFAALALASRDADRLDVAAETIITSCPDHGDEDEAWMDCHCVAAEELNRQARELRKGGA